VVKAHLRHGDHLGPCGDVIISTVTSTTTTLTTPTTTSVPITETDPPTTVTKPPETIITTIPVTVPVPPSTTTPVPPDTTTVPATGTIVTVPVTVTVTVPGRRIGIAGRVHRENAKVRFLLVAVMAVAQRVIVVASGCPSELRALQRHLPTSRPRQGLTPAARPHQEPQRSAASTG
jgi:hypothetical protein